MSPIPEGYQVYEFETLVNELKVLLYDTNNFQENKKEKMLSSEIGACRRWWV